MQDLSTLRELPEHRRLLTRAVEYFQADDRILALIVAGSIANGGADAYSDIDLYILTRAESFAAVFAERDVAATAIGRLLFRFIPYYKSKQGAQQYVVTYANLVKFEFVYYRPADIKPEPKWRHCLIYKDTDGLAADIKAASQQSAPPRPTAAALLALQQQFWTWVWYIFGKLMRGEHWEAWAGLDAVRALVLLPMLAWREDYLPEGYRRLETKAARYREQLAQTVAGLEALALYEALQAEIRFFTELRAALFARHALSWEAEPEELLQRELAQRWRARGSVSDPS